MRAIGATLVYKIFHNALYCGLEARKYQRSQHGMHHWAPPLVYPETCILDHFDGNDYQSTLQHEFFDCRYVRTVWIRTVEILQAMQCFHPYFLHAMQCFQS